MAEEKEILENTFMFSVLKYISYFVLIITGFVITNLLGPAGFGIFSAMMLILKYSLYSFMGFYTACFKKISYYRGMKKEDKIDEVRDSTFTPSFYLTAFISVCIFILSFFLEYGNDILVSLRIVSVLIILQQLYYFYIIYLRADKRFVLFGTVDLVFNVLRLLLVLAFFNFLTVIWVLAATAAAYIISLSIAYKRKPYHFSLCFKPKKAKEMFFFGLPTTFLGATSTLFTSIDKLMIIRFFDRTMLGFYSFAALVIDVITFIPVNISMVLLPSQLERFGAKMEKSRIKNMLTQPMMITSYLIPIIIAAAFFFSEPVIKYLFPKYIESLPVLYALIVGSFFLSDIYIMENFVISINEEKRVLAPKIVSIVLAVVFNYLAIKLSYGIVGVAVVTTAIYIIYFFYLIFFSYRVFSEDLRNNTKDTFSVVFPFIYLVVCVYMLNSLSTQLSGGATGAFIEFIYASLKYVVFLVLNIPLWYHIDRKTGIIRLVFKQIKLRFNKAPAEI